MKNRNTIFTFFLFLFTVYTANAKPEFNFIIEDSTEINALTHVYDLFESTVAGKDAAAHRALYLYSGAPVNIIRKTASGPNHWFTTTAQGFITGVANDPNPYRLDISNDKYTVVGNNVAYSFARFDEYANNSLSAYGDDMFVYVKTASGWKFTQLHNTVVVNGDNIGNVDPAQLPNDILSRIDTLTSAVSEKNRTKFLSVFRTSNSHFFAVDTVFDELYSSTKHGAYVFIDAVRSASENYELIIENPEIKITDHYLAAVTANYQIKIDGVVTEKGMMLITMFGTVQHGWRITSVLRSVDATTVTDVKVEQLGLMDYRLKQNYPNPFNPSTTIDYYIPESGEVKLKVFDTTGKEIATLVNENKNAGNYSVNFNSVGLSSGVYFYRLLSGNFNETKKLVVLK